MKLDKNGWLNLVIGLFGFYFFFKVMELFMGRYGAKVVTATHTTPYITDGFYWVLSFVVALVLSLLLVILFCKPREPVFVGIAILLGGVFGLFNTLYSTIINLDKYFRSEGISAVQYLLPHVIVLIGALLALYIAWLSNKGSKAA
ncbi:MAG TPA: hypothetical protein VHY08_18280 [Bacillota bacterium]|nr:hypothetical protein [Bacillota bacterium]